MALLTDQELRAQMARDYAAAFRRAGLAESHAATLGDARALAELQIVAAAQRNGEIGGGGPRPKADKPGAFRPDVLQAAYDEGGFTRPTGDAVKFRSLHARPQTVSERWGYAVARISRILEGAGRAATFEDGLKNATIPALAKRFADLQGWFFTMGAPPPTNGRADPNPFRGLSSKDASRKFMRLVEDICDASTGVLGSWYVK